MSFVSRVIVATRHREEGRDGREEIPPSPISICIVLYVVGLVVVRATPARETHSVSKVRSNLRFSILLARWGGGGGNRHPYHIITIHLHSDNRSKEAAGLARRRQQVERRECRTSTSITG